MIRYDAPTQVGVSELISETITKPAVTKRNILNVAAAFDTEVSSFIDQTDGEKSALVYIWMFGIEDVVVYGRELDEFFSLMSVLNSYLSRSKQTLIVYVHNYKYDFQFIKTLFNWDIVFAKSKRDILYTRWKQIEFRDSLVLAGGVSLAFIGSRLRNKTYQKMVGDLDYNLLRTPITPLTKKELGYCENDIRVLCEYIREKIEDDGDISKVPYTNTGYVRNFVRNACFKKREKYLKFMDNLTITADGYAAMERAFQGGAVGPNIKAIGKTINDVASRDIKSSYPYVMCAMTFPMSYGHPCPNKDALRYLNSGLYHCQFTLEVFNLLPADWASGVNDTCFPISESKCRELIGATIGSGRVIAASYLKIDITELDFATYKKFYQLDNDNIRISSMRLFTKGYLPEPIVKSILEFFNKKTTLDGVQGREREYMIAKNMLNAIYGMMVEKPVRAEYMLIDSVMEKYKADYVKQIDEYNNKYNRFLYYPWGVWVTAWARYRLYDAIYAVGNDFLYCDTDSVKFTNYPKYENYFNAENEKAWATMEKVATRVGLPLDYCIPTSPKGSRKCLGVWEHEYTATHFKTIGAKRYLYEEDGKLHLTVAGTNKKCTLDFIEKESQRLNTSPFEIFNSNLVVPPEYSKRLVATFIEEERSGWVTDYLGNRYYYSSPSGIHMQPASYSFSLAETTKTAMEILLKGSFIDWRL